MKRLEYKYLVPNEKLAALRCALAPYVEADPHCGTQNEYTVRSIYFDTPKYTYYHEKEAGLLSRKKIRVRVYNRFARDACAFLEIKRKHNMAISKDRVAVPCSNLEALFRSKDINRYCATNADSDAARRFFYHVSRYNLMPTILICYDREAFFHRFNTGLRMTFDKRLRAHAFPELKGLFGDGSLVRSLAQSFIFEVKFNLFCPPWLRRILERFGLERRALSKYTISMDDHRMVRNTQDSF